MVKDIFAHFLPFWLLIFRNDVTKATKRLGEHRKAIGTTFEAASVQHVFIVSCTLYTVYSIYIKKKPIKHSEKEKLGLDEI